MRLVRFGPSGEEAPGLLDYDGRIRDLSARIQDINATSLTQGVLAKLATLSASDLPIVENPGRIGPPIGQVGKIICVGLNYFEHATESNFEVPMEPVLFSKATTAICGPNDPIQLPRGWSKLDWEVELGVVIGREARYVVEKEASQYIAGYCVGNDLSERAFQLERSGQWLKGKSFDTSAPLGPWLVTRDEIPDPQSLDIWCEINGKRYQNSNTKLMIFPVAQLVSYISQFMTLAAGDVILSGTPPGVGLGQKPPQYLKPGDEIRAGIAGLGEQVQIVRTFGETG
jgi:2-keto-4-pentenoate hydratase/2-oxohepta-3-ene-1,7-dioic acid hydratase in catechol pathway